MNRKVCAKRVKQRGVLWLFLLLSASVSFPAMAERRTALVIGNGAYATRPLRNAVNDARTIAKVLRRLKFDVDEQINVSQKEMLRAIIRFGRELEKGGIGLFYYAGHAVQVRQKNFMIPLGAQIKYEDHVEPESVDMNKVIGRMAGARNTLNIVILDACRDNPFRNTFRFVSEGLAQTLAPARTYVAYAAAPGELAADGAGDHSYYTGALVKTLTVPNLNLENIFKRVRADVIKNTRGLQVPWTSSSITDDFYFLRDNVKEVEPRSPKAPRLRISPLDYQVVFWQSMYDSELPEDFEAYLAEFPNGIFASLARNRLKALRPNNKEHNGQRSGGAQSGAARLQKLDPQLLATISKAMGKAKTSGMGYVEQVQAAVEALKALRQKRAEIKQQIDDETQAKIAEIERQGNETMRQKLAAVQRTSDAKFEATVRKAVRRFDAEKSRIVTDTKKSLEARYQQNVAEARQLALRNAAKSVLAAGREAEKASQEVVAQAQIRANKLRAGILAKAEKEAERVRQAAPVEGEKRVTELRGRILANAKTVAERESNRILEDAKRTGELQGEDLLKKATATAQALLAREMADAQQKAKEAVEKAVEEAQRKFDAVRRSAMARAEKAAETLRTLSTAKAQKEAEKERAHVLAAAQQGIEARYQQNVTEARQQALQSAAKSVLAAGREAEKASQKVKAEAQIQANKLRAGVLAKAEKEAAHARLAVLAAAEKQVAELRGGILATAKTAAEHNANRILSDAERAGKLQSEDLLKKARAAAQAQLAREMASAKQKAKEAVKKAVEEAQGKFDEVRRIAMARAEEAAEAVRVQSIKIAQNEAEAERARKLAVARKNLEEERVRTTLEARHRVEEERRRLLAGDASPTDLAKSVADKNASGAQSVNGPIAVVPVKEKGPAERGAKNSVLPARVLEQFGEMSPELLAVVRRTMTVARAEGKNYLAQVQAALDAIKVHRQGRQSP